MICVKFTAFCDLRADLLIRLAFLRKSVCKFWFCKLASTCECVWPGLYACACVVPFRTRACAYACVVRVNQPFYSKDCRVTTGGLNGTRITNITQKIRTFDGRKNGGSRFWVNSSC